VPYWILALFIFEPEAPAPLNVMLPQLLLVVPDCEVNVILLFGSPVALRTPFTTKEAPLANEILEPGLTQICH
jgi:hypothetical protein